MKMVRTVLLGSAAGLMGIGGAFAADLPVKARPVEYVKICNLYGDGFFYVPGSDTCMRIGINTQADFYYDALGGGHVLYDAAGGAHDRTTSHMGSKA
jgi:Porin subfamily